MMTTVLAVAAIVIVTIGPMIRAFVTINIEKLVPAQIEIVAEVALPIPTVKI